MFEEFVERNGESVPRFEFRFFKDFSGCLRGSSSVGTLAA
jgi:hypothetical protein